MPVARRPQASIDRNDVNAERSAAANVCGFGPRSESCDGSVYQQAHASEITGACGRAQ
jgi:hypothetical protein